MADIFLSYKSEDREKVRPLVNALVGRGWSVWWDPRIGVGEKWDRIIEKELAAAKCVLVVWSRLSVDSDWVRAEAEEGRDRQCLVPVMIERVKIPLAFRRFQCTDLTSWLGGSDAHEFLHVCAGVERLVKRRHTGSDGGQRFDACCEALKDAMTNEEFEPLFAIDESSILYMSVGVMDAKGKNEPKMVDHPVYFCPFCGTELQTESEVEAKLTAQGH
jgi:TIR domain-containing protein